MDDLLREALAWLPTEGFDDNLPELRSLRARIQQRLDTGGWIPVAERLPEPHKRVLCKSDFAFVGGYEPDKTAFSIVNDIYVPVAEVKVWRELPALPKEPK